MINTFLLDANVISSLPSYYNYCSHLHLLRVSLHNSPIESCYHFWNQEGLSNVQLQNLP